MEGEVLLPLSAEEPEVTAPGYVERIRNPMAPIRVSDPRSECFVYLEGGPADEDATGSVEKAVLELGSASFKLPVLPVVAGTTVEIRNVGKRTHPLYSPEQADVGEGPPMGPGGVRTFTPKTQSGATHLRSKESLHAETRIVALPTRYFARLGRDGSFSIPKVPQGKWSVRIWVRDGFLPSNQYIDVTNRPSKTQITLPERLPAAAPGAGK